MTGEALYLNGSGINNTGALENLSGKNTWAGAPITLNTASSIGVAGGTLTVTGDVLGLTPAALTKVDTGTLFFPTANVYQGTTYVNNGILNISNPQALGEGLSDAVQSLTITGATTGSFQVTFTDPSGNSQTTVPLLATVPANPTPATDHNPSDSLLWALQSLSNIGVGNVSVTESANIFTITFIGALGGEHQTTITASSSSGTFATPAFVQDGGLGGTVVSGGTLQLQGSAAGGPGLTVPVPPQPAAPAPPTGPETLTLTGNGYLGRGALDSVSYANATSGNVWDNPIILAGNAAIGVTNNPTSGLPGLTVDQDISESISGSQLTKVGELSSGGALGTLRLASNPTAGVPATDTYTGLTTVADGTLQLDKTGSDVAIPVNLTVGDGTGAALTATAQLLQASQIATTATVTVLSDGLFDGNGIPVTIGTLIIDDGTAQSGTGGALTINSLTMTGGTVYAGNVSTSTSGTVTLGGNVTATSDANAMAIITGGAAGVFSLGSAARTFTVTLGSQPADLDIVLPITGSVGLTKAGTGRMELDANSTASFTGIPTVTAGELQVDGPKGTINTVVLAGGTLSGTGQNQLSVGGQVGDIVGSAGAIPSGTIDPGDNGALTATNQPNPTGILTTVPGSGTTETWGSKSGGPTTTFFVDLIDASNSRGTNLTAGTDYDQLLVNGNLNLGGVGATGTNGGAVLTGFVGSNVAIGDQFTIIQTSGGGTITNRFTEPFGEESNGEGIASTSTAPSSTLLTAAARSC